MEWLQPGVSWGPATVSMVLRVLHIITRLELGGAQRNTLHTVAHLDRSRFSVGLVWGPGDVLDSEARELNGVDLFELPSLVRPIALLDDIRTFGALRQAIRSFQPDIVHTHSSKAGILGRAVAHKERIPTVVHSIHGWGFTPLQSSIKRRIFLAAERRVAPWTDHFIAVSQANIDQGRAHGLLGENVSLIRSGIDLSAFGKLSNPANVRRQLAIPDGSLVVTQIGNLKPQKAPLDFVRMAAIVASTNPGVHFVIAGDGPLRRRVEDLVTELGIGDRVHLLGWWADIPALLSLTDIAVLTSRHEGLPRAVVEALAAGVPVVATAVDGTPEVVQDGVNGCVVPPGESEQIAEKVRILLEDEDLRREMGQAGPVGLEDFDIDEMVRKQEELYEWLSGRRS
jgi:glycosyltransferase involved in cell wall biosynthesis